MPQDRRLEHAAQQLRTAQRLFEKAVRECHEAGFEDDEIGVIARLDPEQVREVLDHPRTLRD